MVVSFPFTLRESVADVIVSVSGRDEVSKTNILRRIWSQAPDVVPVFS